MRERIGRVARIGLGLIVAGVAILTGPALLAAAGGQLFGYAICLLSALMWAVYTIAARRVGVDAHAPDRDHHGRSRPRWFLPIYLLLPGQGVWHADARRSSGCS